MRLNGFCHPEKKKKNSKSLEYTLMRLHIPVTRHGVRLTSISGIVLEVTMFTSGSRMMLEVTVFTTGSGVASEVAVFTSGSRMASDVAILTSGSGMLMEVNRLNKLKHKPGVKDMLKCM